jgi:cation-transporting P-type ATPase 13A2
MSVIVKRLKSPSMEVYVKGAPEVMADICDPTSFPKDYDDLLSYYTKHGFRVIAIAGKSVPGLTWLKAQRMKRCAGGESAVCASIVTDLKRLLQGGR